MSGVRAALKGALRAAPASAAYLLVLAATTIALSLASDRTDDRILDDLSTNLHQLGHQPVRVLVGSALWTGGWLELAIWTAVLIAIAAPVERRLGWRRTAAVFAAGHVGATLLVAAGLWVGLRLDAFDPAVERARDVGASYGLLAVCAVATYLIAPRRRLPYVAVLGASVLLAAAFWHTFTDFGHLSAFAIGLACYPLVVAAPGRLAVHGSRATGSPCGEPGRR
jgi:hypothetical protein